MVDEEDNQFYETTTPLTLGPIMQGEVSNIIKGLNNNSANEPDDDDVSAKLLKNSTLSWRTTSML
jgi:hypothetical protein